MIPLSTADRLTLENALESSHSVRHKVFVTDTEGKVKSDLSNRLLGGQVDVDADAEVSRSLSLSLFDPDSQVSFDSDDPSVGAVYMDNMIEVHYGIKYGTMTDYLYIPVFTGPVTGLSRDADTIEVNCLGKEHQALGTFWQNFNAKKGSNKVDVIERIMREGAGETKFLLPDMPNARLGKPLSIVALKQSPWAAAQAIARSMNRVLYYDGAGRLRMRSTSSNKAFSFFGGDNGSLLSIPNISFNTEDMKNAVVVRGSRTITAKKKGQPNKIQSFSAKAVVERTHPLSPYRLGRNGVPLHFTEVIENDKLKSTAQAQRIAENRLTQLVDQTVEVSFDACPIPHLEEWDRVSVEHGDVNAVFTLRQFSIPLTVGDSMSIGYNRRLLTVSRSRIRTTKNSRTRVIRTKTKGKKGKNKKKRK